MHDGKQVDIVKELYKAKMKKRYGKKIITMKERFLKTADQRNMKKDRPASTDKSKETRLCKYV